MNETIASILLQEWHPIQKCYKPLFFSGDIHMKKTSRTHNNKDIYHIIRLFRQHNTFITIKPFIELNPLS